MATQRADTRVGLRDGRRAGITASRHLHRTKDAEYGLGEWFLTNPGEEPENISEDIPAEYRLYQKPIMGSHRDAITHLNPYLSPEIDSDSEA